MNNISDNLKRIRKEKNLTQQQMADILFVTQQTISNWEQGKAIPDLPVLMDVADRLDVEIYELLDDESPKKNIHKTDKKEVIICFVLTVVITAAYIVTAFYDYKPMYFMDGRIKLISRYLLCPYSLFFIFYTAVKFYSMKKGISIEIPFAKQIKIFITVVMIILPCWNLQRLTGIFGRLLYGKRMYYSYGFVNGVRWFFGLIGLMFGLCRSQQKNLK